MKNTKLIKVLVMLLTCVMVLSLVSACGGPAELVSIKVTTNPTKLSYTEGETFDPAGMVVTATYDDDKSVIITDYTVDTTTALTVDDTTVKVSAGDVSVNVTITVVAAVTEEEKLATAKTAAISALEGYVNVEDYRTAEQATLADAITAGTTAINASTATAEVDTALANAKVAIDAIKTDAELTTEEESAAATAALATAKTTAILALEGYVNADDYRTAEQATLTAAITAGTTAINAATATADVDSALANAKAAIDVIKTDAELTADEAALAEAKADRVDELDALTEDLVEANYTADSWSALADAITADKAAIDELTTVDDVNDYTLTATVDLLVRAYTVTVDDTALATKYAEGDTVTLTAPTAPDGFVFSEWTVISGAITITDNAFTMPAEDVKVESVLEEVVLVSIAVTTAPTKTEYLEGDIFAHAGMVVEATYSDDSVKEVTEYSVDTVEALTITDTTATVSWEGKSASVTIYVKGHYNAFVGETDTYDAFANEQLNPALTYEAENTEAAVLAAGKVEDATETNIPSGDKSVGYVVKGDVYKFVVNANKDATATLAFRMGSKSIPNYGATAKVTINDKSVGLGKVSLSGADWYNWTMVVIDDVALVAGDNTITIDVFGEKSANLDVMYVYATEDGLELSHPTFTALSSTASIGDSATYDAFTNTALTPLYTIEETSSTAKPAQVLATDTASGGSVVKHAIVGDIKWTFNSEFSGYATIAIRVSSSFNGETSGQIAAGFSVNGTNIDLTGITTTGTGSNTTYSWQMIVITNVSIAAGENFIWLKTAGTLAVDCIYIYQ